MSKEQEVNKKQLEQAHIDVLMSSNNNVIEEAKLHALLTIKFSDQETTALKKENEELRAYANSVERLLKEKISYYEECEKDFGRTSHSLSKLALLRETIAELKNLKP